MIFEFLQKYYYYELDRRRELTQAVAWPSGILILLSGGLFSLLFKVNIGNEYLYYVFIGLIILNFLLTIISALYLMKSYFNYEYSYVPYPEDIKDYYFKLKTMYKSDERTKDYVDYYIDDDFRNYLIEKYAMLSQKNVKNNDAKSARLHIANRFMIFSVLFAVLPAGVGGYIRLLSG